MFINLISKYFIEKNLPDYYNIKIRDCVSSTNTILKEKALKGEAEFTVLIARRQTAGRGRLGKTFHSPKNSGIYMSVLLKPIESNPLLITTDTAVVLSRVFEKLTGESAGIKWVNDIYIKNRKVCGILAERVENSIVLGIGINIYEPKHGFPDDIKDRAGALFVKKQKGIFDKIIIEVLSELAETYHNPDREKLLEEYKNRSIVVGKKITVIKNGNEEPAKALSIADNYSLVIEKENGEIEEISTGDISIKL